MDAKKKKSNSMDSLKIKNPPQQKIHYIHRNEVITAKMSINTLNAVDYSIDDGFSSISHSISNPNDLNKKPQNSDAVNVNLSLNLG